MTRRKPRDRLIVSNYAVDWRVYDATGEEIDRGSKFFETKDKAEKFAMRFKLSIPREKSADVIIRRLEGNEIVRRLKKNPYKRNYARR